LWISTISSKEIFGIGKTISIVINLINGHSLKFLEHVHRLWECTSIYFQALAEREKDPISFFDLVSCHIKHAVNFRHKMNDRMRSGNARSRYGVEGLQDWLGEGAQMYLDYLPRIAARLSRELEVEESAISEAWVMLMFRVVQG